MLKSLSIFTGNANRALAEEICKFVEIPLGRSDVTHFSDGEIYVEIGENVRGVTCFVVQPTCAPTTIVFPGSRVTARRAPLPCSAGSALMRHGPRLAGSPKGKVGTHSSDSGTLDSAGMTPASFARGSRLPAKRAPLRVLGPEAARPCSGRLSLR